MSERKWTSETAEWAAGLQFESIPARIVEESKLQLLSVIAAMMAGARTDAGRRILNALSIRGEKRGAYPMLMTNESAEMADSFAAATALSLSLDYDDYLMCGHTGHSAAIVPLIASGTQRIDGRKFIAAQVAANEIGARIGMSVSVGEHNGQMWAYLHAAAAAVAMGKLLGVSADEMSHAIGISLARPCNPLVDGFMGGESKLMLAAGPLWDGVTGARLAASGVRGPENIFESANGFCAAYSHVPVLGAFSGYGSCWLSDTLSYKIYPGCAYIDSPMDALFEILETQPIDPNEVNRVRIFANLLTVKMDETARPYVRYEKTIPGALNFYLPYNIAVGVYDGRLTPDQLTPSRINDADVWLLSSRVRVTHDLKWTKGFLDSLSGLIDMKGVLSGFSPSAAGAVMKKVMPFNPMVLLGHIGEVAGTVREGMKFVRDLTEKVVGDGSALAETAEGFRMACGARVEIELKNGKKLEVETEVPRGAAGWTIEQKRAEVQHKFQREAKKLVSAETAARIMRIVNELEDAEPDTVKELVGLLCFDSSKK